MIVKRNELTWFERLYLPALIGGLKVTTRHFINTITGTTKVTQQYPEEPTRLLPGYRGAPYLVHDQDGATKCVSCQLCEFVCPPKAIKITPPGPNGAPADRANAEKMPREFEINMLRCIFCGYCQEVCPEEAIFLKSDFSLTGLARDGGGLRDHVRRRRFDVEREGQREVLQRRHRVEQRRAVRHDADPVEQREPGGAVGDRCGRLAKHRHGARVGQARTGQQVDQHLFQADGVAAHPRRTSQVQGQLHVQGMQACLQQIQRLLCDISRDRPVRADLGKIADAAQQAGGGGGSGAPSGPTARGELFPPGRETGDASSDSA